MKIRQYLDRKKILTREGTDTPRYVLTRLKAHERPTTSKPEPVNTDTPETRGLTP
jgi:hypothetical protein